MIISTHTKFCICDCTCEKVLPFPAAFQIFSSIANVEDTNENFGGIQASYHPAITGLKIKPLKKLEIIVDCGENIYV